MQGIVSFPDVKQNLLLASAYQVAIYNCVVPHTGGLYKVQPCGASKLNGCIYLTRRPGQVLLEEEDTDSSRQEECCLHRANLQLACDIGILLKKSVYVRVIMNTLAYNNPTLCMAAGIAGYIYY